MLALSLFTLCCMFALAAASCSDRSPPTPNGVWAPSTAAIGTPSTLSCNSGFTRVGNQTRLCLNSGNWSVAFVGCFSSPCPELSPPAFGLLSAPSASDGASVSFACLTGYSFSGTAIRTCSSNTWSGSADQLCTANPCSPSPLVLVNGIVSPPSGSFGDLASFSCNAGYRLFGSSNRTCLATGLWSSTSPVCVPLACPDLLAPADGTADYLTGFTGSTSTFACNVGFTLQGTASRTCQPSLSWSGLADQVCQANPCSPNPTAPANGAVSLTLGRTRDVVLYSCNLGHSLLGRLNHTCLPNGTWSFSSSLNSQTCVPNPCPTMLAPRNGLVDGQAAKNGSFGSTFTLQCNTGYWFAPALFSAVLTCQANGTWLGYNASLHSSCANRPCPIFEAPLDGTANGRRGYLQGIVFGDLVQFVCDAGFTRSGASSMTCQSDGTYSIASLPLCDPNSDCFPPELPSPANGLAVLQLDATLGRHVMDFSCNAGYVLAGSATRRICRADTTWSEAASPTCLPQPCLVNATAPAFGTLDFGNGVLESNTTVWPTWRTGMFRLVRCNQGYVPASPRANVTCLASGTWSDAPACLRRPCLPPFNTTSSLGNGTLSINGTGAGVFGETAFFTCNFGFSLNLTQRIGNASIANGTFVSVPLNVTSMACNNNGTWVGRMPSCVLVRCPPAPLLNGLVAPAVRGTSSSIPGAVASYSCNTGYVLVPGGESRTCLLGGSWSGAESVCSPRPCVANLTAPANGTVSRTFGVVEDVALFSCNAGYALSGTASRRCLVSFIWSGAADQVCRAVPCLPSLSHPRNGSVSNGNGTTTQFARFSCSPGFTLSGEASRECLTSGNWSGSSNPTCVANACAPDLVPPNNGSVSRVNGTTGDTASFACLPGFDLIGAGLALCQADGNWSTAASPPVCRVRGCLPDLLAPRNGSVSLSAGLVGDRAVFACSPGFDLAGPSVLVCQANYTWSSTLRPTCVPRPCVPLVLVAPSNGTASLTTGGVTDSTSAFRCNTGYSLVGAPLMTCLASGNWSAPNNQVCSPLTVCNPPSFNAPAFGTLTLTTSPGTGDVTATFACNTGYVLRGGSTARVCRNALENWSGGVGQFCEPKTCLDTLVAPANGQVTAAGVGQTGLTALFSCNRGYGLAANGASVARTCLASGLWDGTDGQACEAIGCTSEPPALANGNVSETSVKTKLVNSTTGAVVRYTTLLFNCSFLYRLSTTTGELELECPLGGQVTLPSVGLPTCQFVLCPVFELENGRRTFEGGRQRGAKVSALCDPGYFPSQGVSTLTCSRESVWVPLPALLCVRPSALVFRLYFVGLYDKVDEGVTVSSEATAVPTGAVLEILPRGTLRTPVLSVADGARLVLHCADASFLSIESAGSLILDGVLDVIVYPSVDFSVPIRIISYAGVLVGSFVTVNVTILQRAGEVLARDEGNTYRTGLFACSTGICTLSPVDLARPSTPAGPNKQRALALAIVLGGIVGLLLLAGLVFAVMRIRRRSRGYARITTTADDLVAAAAVSGDSSDDIECSSISGATGVPSSGLATGASGESASMQTSALGSASEPASRTRNTDGRGGGGSSSSSSRSMIESVGNSSRTTSLGGSSVSGAQSSADGDATLLSESAAQAILADVETEDTTSA